MLDIRDATVYYPSGVQGVDNLNLHVDDGEFCFITGASGSGKSTLSKLITGELLPDVGTVRVNGYNMSALDSKTMAEARRTIGMVFQDFRLITSMTVEENLEFAMRCIGVSRNMEERIARVLSIVHLEGKEYRYPSELSGGEQQRVAIARAIINRPRLVIADEPTGNLDPKLAEEIIKIFVDINGIENTTVIVITHAKELVAKFRKRTIVLSAGRIYWEGGGAS
jgi:cell division transport system ATP-binding protein